MATIRELFHEIGNWHNKISMGAGVTKEMLKQKTKDNSSLKEIKGALIKKLAELERHAIGASNALNKLKAKIYSLVNPDRDIQKINSKKEK